MVTVGDAYQDMMWYKLHLKHHCDEIIKHQKEIDSIESFLKNVGTCGISYVNEMRVK